MSDRAEPEPPMSGSSGDEAAGRVRDALDAFISHRGGEA